MFAICRYWGQPPKWLDSLPGEEKEILIADYILNHQTKEQSQEHKNRYNERILEKARHRWENTK